MLYTNINFRRVSPFSNSLVKEDKEEEEHNYIRVGVDFVDLTEKMVNINYYIR